MSDYDYDYDYQRLSEIIREEFICPATTAVIFKFALVCRIEYSYSKLGGLIQSTFILPQSTYEYVSRDSQNTHPNFNSHVFTRRGAIQSVPHEIESHRLLPDL